MQKLITLLFSALLLASTVHAEQEFLDPDQAFIISGNTPEAGKVRVSWRIADDYYLYRTKFRFSTDTAGVNLGSAKYPPAETKQDPFFGEIEIYRGKIQIDVPVTENTSGTDLLELKVISQGCADAGICYPPHTQTLLLALNGLADQPLPVNQAAVADMEEVISNRTGSETGVANSVEPSINPLQEISQLGQSIGFGDDDILPVEEAFRFFADVQDGKTLKLRWDIADGTYLYQNKVELQIEGNDVALGNYELPAPEIKKNSIKPDGTIGDVLVYHHAVDLLVPLLRSNTDPSDIKLTAKYQGCADRGICYPPAKTTVGLSLPKIEVADSAAIVAATTADTSSFATEESSEQDQIASLLTGGNTWVILASFFGIGLLLSFTPCVFPMIPILSGIIAGQGSELTTRKAFVLSMVYVLAMAFAYTVAGILAGMFGANLQAAFQNPWILSGFAAVFVLLAFSMFGFYELQLPSSLQGKLSEVSNKQQGGTLMGVAIMGLLSALIVGPCVAPPLAGALIYIGQTGDAVLGGMALFAMSMGMGAPLVAIGTSAGKILPRAGAWMDIVKAVFGVTMLAIAISLLERIIPEAAAMLLWGTLLIVSAVYMGALHQLPVEASGWMKLWKGLGVAMLIYGTTFLIGVAADGKDPLQPLRGILVGGGAEQRHVTFKRIKTTDDLAQELAIAKAAGRPVMLDFYADWCVYCKQMERNTFPDPAVRAYLDNFILLQADVTDQDEADKTLQKQIGIPAPPAMIFWGADGQEQHNLRLLGFMGPGEFAQHLARVK